MTDINELGPQEAFAPYQKPKLNNASVGTKQLQDLEKLFIENKEAFAEDERQTTPFIKMSIDTGDHKPMVKRPYTIYKKQCDWIRKAKDKLCQEALVREMHSSWSAQIVVVLKGHDVNCICVDYRAFSIITRAYV